MKTIEYRALMGDKEAQMECTQQGIALPCPCCEAPMEKKSGWFYHSNVRCILGLQAFKISDKDCLDLWNRRPAPPIGRCKDCKHLGERIVHETGQKENFCNHDRYGLFAFDSTEAYCGYFEPKEKTK